MLPACLICLYGRKKPKHKQNNKYCIVMNLKNGPDVIKYFMFEPAHYDCTKCKTLENVFFLLFDKATQQWTFFGCYKSTYRMDGMKKCNFPTTYNVNFVESLKVTFTLAVCGDTFRYYSYTTDTNTMLQNCFKCGNLSKKILHFFFIRIS